MRLKILNIKYSLLLVFLLSLLAVKPFFHSGFFPMHDDTQVARVYQMAQALRDGQFPVRWVKDLGYGFGYPIFNFYAPLAYYVGALFNLVGFNALAATKIMFGMGIILAGVTMYFLAREFWGEAGGVVAALFYVYAPYHAVDIYVRGAVSELLAMAFLPLVFLGVYRRRVLLAAISLAAVILSHNLTALMLMPFLFLLLLVLFVFSKNKKQFLILNSKFLILAVGLAAFYWLPALIEMGQTKVLGQIGGGADWRDHFVFFDQLWASPWGFGGSAPGRLDGMSFMIGKLHFLAAFLSLLVLYQVWRRQNRRLIAALVVAWFFLLIAVFLIIQNSFFVWQFIRPMVFIQYPWRFLSFASLASSFIAGSVVLCLRKKGWLTGAVAVLALSVLLFFNIKYFQPQFYNNLSNFEYINEQRIKWKISKISDEYLPRDFPTPQTKNEVAWEKVELLEGEAEIKNADFKSHVYNFDVDAESNSQILINTAYFSGWQVFVDDGKVNPAIEAGRIKLAFIPGVHRVTLKFTNTPIRSWANLISLLSLAYLIWLLKKMVRI